MAARKIGGIAVSLELQVQKFMRGIGLAQKSLTTFGAKAKASLAGLSGMAKIMGAGGLAIGLKSALDGFEGLNKSMTRSLAIMGDVSDAMRGDMRKAAIEVAKVSNFSASQAADAYFFLASAGLNAAQALGAMPTVAKFATAGNFDLAQATDLLTDAQSALGLTVKDTAQNMKNMTRLGDVLVKANVLANASVEQFSIALTTKAGASMKLLGMDVEEGVAVLAAFADQGLKAEEAGTAFGIVTRDLQTKALKNTEAFKRLGIAVYDSQGEFRNMADIVGDMERALDGMSDAQKKATLLSLGFADKSVAYQQMLLGTSDKIRGYEEELRKASGTMDHVANNSLTDLEKATNSLKGSWQELLEVIGPGMAKAAETAIKALQDITASLAQDPDSTVGMLALEHQQMTKGNNEYMIGLWDSLWNVPELSDAVTGKGKGRMFGGGTGAPKSPVLPMPRGLANARAFSRGLPEMKLPDSWGAAIGKALTSVGAGINAAKDQVGFGAMLRNQMWLTGNANFGAEPTKAEKKTVDNRNSLALAESGSVESYRQQAAMRRQNEGVKLDKDRNKILEKIERKISANNVNLLAANF
jgi:TP901 family phage tail tape measure protein